MLLARVRICDLGLRTAVDGPVAVPGMIRAELHDIHVRRRTIPFNNYYCPLQRWNWLAPSARTALCACGTRLWPFSLGSRLDKWLHHVPLAHTKHQQCNAPDATSLPQSIHNKACASCPCDTAIIIAMQSWHATEIPSTYMSR